MLLFAGGARATTADLLSDSLQHVLSHTADPELRISLLLDIKDLNEEMDINLPVSIQLFREAVEINDTYAMSVAIVPILNHYSTYAEKEDSLHLYIQTIRERTPSTPQEGIDAFAEMSIAINRIRGEYDPGKQKKLVQEGLARYQSSASVDENIYHHIQQLILTGYTAAVLTGHGTNKRKFTPQIDRLKEAYALILQIPQPAIRMLFGTSLYSMLGRAYTQASNYSELVALSDNYIRILDDYCEYEHHTGRRPHLYTDNIYIKPYRQLIRCAFNIGDTKKAEAHFQQLRTRMLAASGQNLTRNKSLLYETGSQWMESLKNYDQSLQYCDSLINLIESGKGYYRMMPDKIILAYCDRSRILTRTGRYGDAFLAYDRAFVVMDSLNTIKSDDRFAAIRRSHDMSRMQLRETRAAIQNQVMGLITTVGAVLLLIAAGVYFYRGLRRNRKLQVNIFILSRKAQESERMKSNFLNSICNDIREPFHAIDHAAWKLTAPDMPTEEQAMHLNTMRKNTAQLLSTLDNMLEAASLGSLTEKLQLKPTDIHALCQAELCHAQQQYPGRNVEYIFEYTEEMQTMRTHARYFSLVIRALLDNAAKFTSEGRITLRCETGDNRTWLHIYVSDTGPGIDLEHQKTIFSAESKNSSARHGQSLALCNLIAFHMQGGIRIDESYSPGARFIFTIPRNP